MSTQYIYITLLLILILMLYIYDKKLHRQEVKNLKKEKKISKKYVEDLNKLLFMLTRFQEMGMTYRKANDLEQLCNLIVEYATELASTDMGSLMLIDKTTNRLKIEAAKGLTKEVVEKTSMVEIANCNITSTLRNSPPEDLLLIFLPLSA